MKSHHHGGVEVDRKSEAQAIQRRVAHFVKRHGLEAPLEHRVLDLVSEVGELAKEILKGTDYGRIAFRDVGTLGAELGDVLFSVICVANSTGIELDAALDQVLAKYSDRIRTRRDPGSKR